ncbi:MAG: DUF5421 family protein [Chlamydiales bacterium]
MKIPPSNRETGVFSKRERNKEPVDHKKTNKDFTLPRKKEESKDKKESLFDIAGAELGLKELKQSQEFSESQEIASQDISEIKTDITAISKLIQNMVKEMQIGQLEGKDFANIQLSEASMNLPEAFLGSHLTLSYEENQLTIHFDNFMTPQQENNAMIMVEKHKQQLLDMIQTLQQKNIYIKEMSIGERAITLPRIESHPTAFRSIAAQEGTMKEDQKSGYEKDREEETSSE